jgi:hypothetical protein
VRFQPLFICRMKSGVIAPQGSTNRVVLGCVSGTVLQYDFSIAHQADCIPLLAGIEYKACYK